MPVCVFPDETGRIQHKAWQNRDAAWPLHEDHAPSTVQTMFRYVVQWEGSGGGCSDKGKVCIIGQSLSKRGISSQRLLSRRANDVSAFEWKLVVCFRHSVRWDRANGTGSVSEDETCVLYFSNMQRVNRKGATRLADFRDGGRTRIWCGNKGNFKLQHKYPRLNLAGHIVTWSTLKWLSKALWWRVDTIYRMSK